MRLKVFFNKNFPFSHCEPNFLSLLSKVFPSVVPVLWYPVGFMVPLHESLSRNFFLGKLVFFSTISEIERKIFGLWSKIFQGLSKLFLACPYDNFVEKFILGSYDLHFFAH